MSARAGVRMRPDIQRLLVFAGDAGSFRSSAPRVADPREAGVNAGLESLLVGDTLQQRRQEPSLFLVQGGKECVLVLAGNATHCLERLAALCSQL